MKAQIEKSREALFNNQMDVFMVEVTVVLDMMVSRIHLLGDDEKKIFNELLVDFDIYIKNGDYLMATDLMKFEIEKLFKVGGH